MKKKIKILAIIPCRSGSKGIKNKNIIDIFGKPLIYYSIFFAKKCKFIDKVLVSTDSKEYQKIAQKYGAEVPFLRPSKISTDNSLDVDFFKHALKWLKKNQGYQPDYVIHLRPTSPIRKIKILQKAINIIKKNKKITSIRSISLLNKSAYKIWFLKKNFLLKSITKNKSNFLEPCNAPRQKLKKTYFQNGVYDIFNVKIIENNLISGKNIYGLITDEECDIDTNDDLINIKQKSSIFKNFEKYILN